MLSLSPSLSLSLSLSSAALKRAQLLLTMKHGIARLDNVWGIGGGQRPVMFIISKVSNEHSSPNKNLHVCKLGVHCTSKVQVVILC